ncbi:PstS family phosphate ABC transporter substrate-binding protein [Ammoniphilus sp. YIM 78166]|uniref:PstS family phosphate ABC transporter substrate-binding protein n=1 Tax=Ammoniphilus sp. YIM 78166 TaxID=1644106 RepID=UPI0010705830|nr:PstS family phosphate ABC transporter substrate-binding protein [Ammoniphilus sp. YIM 78166]
MSTLLLAFSIMTGCGGTQQPGGAEQPAPGEQPAQESTLSGTVLIDGSSTVFPITEAVAEEFQAANPNVRVTVGVSGTGGGFKKFVPGEIDINNASRKIKDNEVEGIKANGFEAIEVPIAFDGISVVVNPANDWVDYLTVEELSKIWAPDSTVKTWSEVREGWPAEEIKLYGPGTDSGTFGYFTEVVNGKEGASRSDYTASEDDNVLVQGVTGDKNALGYFGFAYYQENSTKMKAVPIKATADAPAVEPTHETINDGTYTPFSRELYMYVSSKSLADKPEIKAFAQFYLDHAAEMAELVGYVAMPAERYEEAKKLVQ